MKERTSQDLALPLFIGAAIGLISAVSAIIQNLKSGNVPLYAWTSVASTLFLVVVYLYIGMNVKKDRIYGDWDVLMSFLLGCILILAVTGILSVISCDPEDTIAATSVTTGAIDLIAAVIVAFMYTVMKYRKIDAVVHFVFWLLVISVIAVVAIAAYNLINVSSGTSDLKAIFSAFGGLVNKVLIAAVLLCILRRGEVRSRLFSKENDE